MNTQTITIDEYENDGSFINLYRNNQIGAWCAYGYSAYGLRLFSKSNGYNSLRNFSEEVQMPCSIVGDETFRPFYNMPWKLSSRQTPIQKSEYRIK